MAVRTREHHQKRFRPSDVSGEYNRTATLRNRFTYVISLLKQRIEECKGKYPGCHPEIWTLENGEKKMVDVPNYYSAEEYKILSAAHRAAALFTDEIDGCRIAVFEGNVMQNNKAFTTAFGDMLFKSDATDHLYRFILQDLQDKTLAKTLGLIATHFREKHPGGKHTFNDHTKKFSWEEEWPQTLHERLLAMVNRLPSLPTPPRLLALEISDIAGKGVEVLSEGRVNITPATMQSVHQKIRKDTDLFAPADVDELCEWIDRNDLDADGRTIDAQLTRDIKKLLQCISYYEPSANPARQAL